LLAQHARKSENLPKRAAPERNHLHNVEEAGRREERLWILLILQNIERS